MAEEWIRTGREDARMGEMPPTHQELIAENEDFMEVSYQDWQDYMAGFLGYEADAARNGRSVDEQIEHDANGGDWVWVA